ncbi:DmsC/YnfH family molybdoenzyme membrane anchor subunit [Photobacterium andalusiense]|uniref:Anaerobic dimethyl sulfoxide reductase chain C n=1 Tax=Photobacterium andalusiense TaxID=2204296 RepID=A0A1Y6MA30_9GAMM|nr:DmsC/YnfH family molybdoenzyme membrane anchor subunit [Photobacterium andalusiense]SMY32588.1 Anaerobic dimethyl sulfoxide reductase chain C [Photobacterium andalusiense]
MAWHEWPLIVFTVLAQTAVGAYLLVGSVILRNTLTTEVSDRLHKAMFFIWVLMGLGFMASTMHLGSPLRAFNALNQVGSSWLSNEIFTGSLFFALGGSYWLLALLKVGPIALRKIILVIGMLVGISFIYSMIMVYLISTVPTWNTLYTPLAFVLTAILSGLILGHLLLTIAKHNNADMDNALPLVGAIFAAIYVVIVIGQIIELHSTTSALGSAMDIIPNLMQLQIIRIGLLFAAIICWFIPRLIKARPTLFIMLLSLIFILLAELTGRGIFYGLHMTVGL